MPNRAFVFVTLSAMIDLYTWPTPNGRKVSIALEELGLDYRVHPVNIAEGEQLAPDFVQLSPNNKIPAIKDHENNQTLFESGAILIYLADKTDRLSGGKYRWQVLEWLMLQMASVGPMFGQTHHFHRFKPGIAPYAEERFLAETHRLYGVLENRLKHTEFLAEDYSIADIATFPWVARWPWHSIDWATYPNLARWFRAVAASPSHAQTAVTAPTLVQTPEAIANLKYEAFVAGIPAGEARLTLARQKLAARGAASFSYKVTGTARSKGLWESIQKWRAEYSVDGEVHHQSQTQGQQSETALLSRVVLPGHFYSLQTTPKKRREIHIEDGVLKETKNNKVRDPRPAQTGFDLLSALFFLPACHPEVRVHTGRDGYTMRRTQPAVPPRGQLDSAPIMRCSYGVTDEEGGNYKMTLVYKRMGEFVVPADISAQGPVSGRMVLAEP